MTTRLSSLAVLLLSPLLIFAPLSSWSAIQKYYSTQSLLEDSDQLSWRELYWLNAGGPLSKTIGVTGSRGPLGSLGPLGNSVWNVTPYFNGFTRLWSSTTDTSESPAGLWRDLALYLQEMAGPLSALGPMSIPILWNDVMAFWQMIFRDDSDKLLAAGGTLALVGPSGPLGPLGIGGLLGPHGGHGYARNADGSFFNEAGHEQRGVTVETLNGAKDLELYEFYPASAIKQRLDLDTSWASEGKLLSGESVTFQAISQHDQWVNIAVINLFDLDAFALSVITDAESSEKTIRSADRLRTNFISVFVEKGTKLRIQVELLSSSHFLPGKPYRLFVTGATADIYQIERSYQRAL